MAFAMLQPFPVKYDNKAELTDEKTGLDMLQRTVKVDQ